MKTNLRSLLIELYGETAGLDASVRLSIILDRYRDRIAPQIQSPLTERDTILITYPDQVRESQVPPLKTLEKLCRKYLTGLINSVHLLPFYPSSSDDGFSVVDYHAVNPDLGTWSDIHELGASFRLMFDAVINHVSIRSEWFQSFLLDDPAYRDYFIVVENDPDLSQIVRPRALPLLTRFDTNSGTKQVWTTFSADQVDLNYKNPAVLLEIIDILLLYAAQGATLLRLDAIAYLWKEIGTSCIHLPQTHHVIQLIRAVLDEAAPHVMLITETNVTHEENVSYFGNGKNGAQLVYNFALPPLTLYTFYTGDAQRLSNWAKTLILPSDKTTFFNFLASHDGIGLNPARGILSEDEIDLLVRKTIQHGGLVSYKRNADGMQSPYELNINYFDALSDPNGEEPLDLQVDRFMAAQAIMLSLVGVPGIYFHSLFGSRGWMDGVIKTGHKRAINRKKLDRVRLENKLADPSTLRCRVFDRYTQLLRARNNCPAFHPQDGQRILPCNRSIFALVRLTPTAEQRVLCIQNISNQTQSLKIDFEDIFGLASRGRWLSDLITNERFTIRRKSTFLLSPYRTLWLIREQ
ncbi:MAG: sugar phosphorylase [Chloroflexota bacterium]